MSSQPDGRIITFYSYKGGAGRTMAAANVAWILAANGFRVLVSDWDLETPGLHHYLHPFLPPDTITSTTGLIDLFAGFAEEARTVLRRERVPGLYRDHARVRPHAVSVDWPFPAGGRLDYLSAGRRNRDYLSTLASFDWSDLDEPFLEALRQDVRRNYDFALIDSRTGLGSAVEICTRDLPDILVSCFTLNSQSIEGASDTARYIDQTAPARGITIFPVLMRINEGSGSRAIASGMRRARERFHGLPRGLSAAEADRYWELTQIPYRPEYDCEEILATFGDRPGEPNGLLAAYERLASLVAAERVTGLPTLDESLRLRHLGSFIRPASPEGARLILHHAPRDRMWAEWIRSVLTQAGFHVLAPDATDTPDEARAVAVVSAAFLRTRLGDRLASQAGGTARDAGRAPILLQIGDGEGTPGTVLLGGLDESAAASAVLRAIGAAKPSGPSHTAARFPGRGPTVFGVPARNPQFSGRDLVLDGMHDALGVNRALVMVATEPRGLGRRQLAIEYAHRFGSDYDLIWWVPAASRQTALSALARLARKLDLPPGPDAASAADAALAVLTENAAEARFGRWLLIYEDAAPPRDLDGLLPNGGGRILVTSRHSAWTDEGMDVLQAQEFNRRESAELLRSRKPGLNGSAAAALAEALGDVPLALHQAARRMARTGESAEDYRGRLALAPDGVDAGTWTAYTGLQQSAPAAHRLLELCSCFAPLPVPLIIVQSEVVLDQLRRYDPTLSNQLELGPLVLELDHAGLVEVDQPAQRLRVPELVRRTVLNQLTGEVLATLGHEAHRVLVAVAPAAGGDEDSWFGRREFEELWPHFDACGADRCRAQGTRAALLERVRRTVQLFGADAGSRLAQRLDEAWKLADGGADGVCRTDLEALLQSFGTRDRSRATTDAG
ncbi:FxSxx-COOH system tetratricopeptide repeat protein [Streptacidiphilus jiangxiensis]|uniref:MinD-like ATPase involved in chromosome partitioning or flagellar assembly n=1 Tax=Streptacidiphilus jiangxiensis TaxID=235985 RepID=A0A1H7HWD7_STRJI|nr:FxSxx-COOH system tetratricopeptide repeat protein [Streptacidiphilus jiangxiensis]SEK54596.1 MinD-like ATPase involved in chromosome partitioning or flagellar assembly [Streptacidiphilus jiangxiensis]